MALFTDAPISTLDQLAAQDSAVLDVASTEGIDAAAKIALAQEEIGVELMAVLARAPYSLATPSAWWPGSVYQNTLSLLNIAVTPPLQLWHTFRTLALIYRDAYGTQLNDRYLGKWNAYNDLSKWASEMLWQTGVGVVSDPVVIASIPTVSVLSGTLSAATYFIQTSWLNVRGEEGVASAVVAMNAPDQSSVQVHANNPPGNAAAWNIYAGTSIDSIMLQNPSPTVLGQIWVLPAAGLSTGRSPGTGQAPNYFRQLPRYLQRG